MNNQLKSKTRLAFIQIIFQFISTNNDMDEIFNTFNTNYKSTYIENFKDKKKIKFEFNSNFLKKLKDFYIRYTNANKHISIINKKIDFNRDFEKWDIINQSILLAALSEITNTESSKVKIVLNDYLNIGKLFINQKDISFINAIIDKLINEKI